MVQGGALQPVLRPLSYRNGIGHSSVQLQYPLSLEGLLYFKTRRMVLERFSAKAAGGYRFRRGQQCVA